MPFTKDTALHGHTSEDTAYLVDDYPYGFRLRTQIRYWIETNKKHGDRFVSQTLNPKTGQWNKPKKSTYTLVGCMFLDEQDHVTWAGIGWYDDTDAVARYVDTFGEENLNVDQQAQVAVLRARNKVMEHVTVTVQEGSYTDAERAEQDAAKQSIARAVRVQAARELADLQRKET